MSGLVKSACPFIGLLQADELDSLRFSGLVVGESAGQDLVERTHSLPERF